MTYSSSHVWSKIRWCMNLTPDQKIQTDETFFIISYSYHPTGALFFSNMFQKTATFSVSRWLSAHVGSTRVFTGVQRETACGHGFRQLLPSDDLDVHQAFQLFPQKMNLEKTLDSIIHCHSVAQEGFKHWLSHSMPGMRKRNSPCWRTHPRHQCLQCVDAKICGPQKYTTSQPPTNLSHIGWEVVCVHFLCHVSMNMLLVILGLILRPLLLVCDGYGSGMYCNPADVWYPGPVQIERQEGLSEITMVN